MPYLSDHWTLAEAVTWIATRNPEQLAATRTEFDAAALKDPAKQTPPSKRKRLRYEPVRLEKHSAESSSLGPSYKILDELVSAMLSGHIRFTAQNIATGQRQPVPNAERDELQFCIANDLPGSPFGLQSRADRVFRWRAPMVIAADILQKWPRNAASAIINNAIQDDA